MVTDHLRSESTAAFALASPQAVRLTRPRWRDTRLLAGVLLVLLAVVLGARLMATADDTVAVWSLTRALDAGAPLQADDLRPVNVRLGEASNAYVGVASGLPTGYVAARPLSAGELLAVGAVTPAGSGPALRNVTVAVGRFHAPADVGRGQRVDVYVTPDDGATALTVSGALVADVVTDGGRLGPSGDGMGVVLAVPPEDVQVLVQAVQDGAIDLVRVSASP